MVRRIVFNLDKQTLVTTIDKKRDELIKNINQPSSIFTSKNKRALSACSQNDTTAMRKNLNNTMLMRRIKTSINYSSCSPYNDNVLQEQLSGQKSFDKIRQQIDNIENLPDTKIEDNKAFSRSSSTAFNNITKKKLEKIFQRATQLPEI